MDYTQQNATQAAVWAAFSSGAPTRVPMSISANERMLLLDPALNPDGVSFADCYANPEIMFETMLRFQYWYRHCVPGDFEHGLPEQWTIGPGFQNYYDAAWFGAEIHFMDNAVPDTRPLLTEDKKRLLFDRGIPDPFANIMGRGRDFQHYFRERACRETFHDRPITVGAFYPALGSDGPFTVACNLRGATEFCLDLYEDPEYAQELMAYIVEATITRQRAWLLHEGLPLERSGVGIADDSIALLSCAAYRECVLPHHQRLLSALRAPEASVWVHLCGDATRHFVTIRDELGATSFDTGFPVDHGQLRKALGPEITISGGPHVEILLHGTPAEVEAETRRILHSGVMDGGKFILKEANNLAPCTPLTNLEVMYATCQREGVFV